VESAAYLEVSQWEGGGVDWVHKCEGYVLVRLGNGKIGAGWNAEIGRIPTQEWLSHVI
jgi:hypothetical protein